VVVASEPTSASHVNEEAVGPETTEQTEGAGNALGDATDSANDTYLILYAVIGGAVCVLLAMVSLSLCLCKRKRCSKGGGHPTARDTEIMATHGYHLRAANETPQSTMVDIVTPEVPEMLHLASLSSPSTTAGFAIGSAALDEDGEDDGLYSQSQPKETHNGSPRRSTKGGDGCTPFGAPEMNVNGDADGDDGMYTVPERRKTPGGTAF